MTFKQQVYQQYVQLVQDRIDVFRDMIAALTDDAQNDAKGSAGDKHETALSMMHIEQEKLNHKLQECLEQKAILDKIDLLSITGKTALGSLVQTNKLLLFVSCALPKKTVDGKPVFAISPQSPLGSQVMGKSAGHSFEINGTGYVIETID